MPISIRQPIRRPFRSASALLLALSLAACAQGAGRAPEAPRVDREVFARTRVVAMRLMPEENYRAHMAQGAAEVRAELSAALLAESFTPAQVDATIDGLNDAVWQSWYKLQITLRAFELARICGPKDGGAIANDELVSCVMDNWAEAERAAAPHVAEHQRSVYAKAVSTYLDQLDQRAPELGLTKAQVAMLRQAFQTQLGAD